MEKRVQNKRVILVGPHPLQNEGDWIDQFDIIVRLKKGFPVPEGREKDLGTHTHIWYTNLMLLTGSN